MQQKMRVKLRPSEWTNYQLDWHKLKPNEWYIVKQDKAGEGLILEVHPDKPFIRSAFTTPEPLPTPCPSDWQPAPGHTVDHYEAECIDDAGVDTIKNGQTYPLRIYTTNGFGLINKFDRISTFPKTRFSTPTLRAEYRDKPEQVQSGETVRLNPTKWNGFDLYAHSVAHDKSYKVIADNGSSYTILNDNGKEITFDYCNFIVEEKPIQNIKQEQPDPVNHPTHYGGENNVYEVIKVLDAWGLKSDAYLWNVAKYIGRAGKKQGNTLMQELLKAQTYLQWRIEDLENDGTPKEMTVELLIDIAMELLQQAKNMMQDGSKDI